MAYIDIIEPEDATGTLQEIYQNLQRERGKLARIHKIQSLNPESIRSHMDLYMTLMFRHSPLSRPQREMMAVVVSAVNGCEYCQLHHQEALNHYWKDRSKVEQLRKDYTTLELSEKDLQLCNLAVSLTKDPEQIEESSDIDPLKESGFSDRAVLDAVLIIGYFNFVNRVVEGLGVEADENEVSGYKY